MGKQSSKIKDILFVTGADLDPEELKVQKKSNPTKDMKVDYRSYIPRSYYMKDATDEEIEEHLRKVQVKEDILKNFKCYKDFDRINMREMQLNIGSFEVYVEQMTKFNIVMSLSLARLIQMQLFSEYFTISGWLKFYGPCFLTMYVYQWYRAITSPEYHIVNHEYFRLVDDQTALYQQFDYELNLYKDVDDMKYNFKYPTVAEFYKKKREIMERGQMCFKGQYRDYYQYYNQLKFDKYEEFIKKRQKERKNSNELITASQQQEILANLDKSEKVI